jgi:hypothetical protein
MSTGNFTRFSLIVPHHLFAITGTNYTESLNQWWALKHASMSIRQGGGLAKNYALCPRLT